MKDKWTSPSTPNFARRGRSSTWVIATLALLVGLLTGIGRAAGLSAGAAKIEITDRGAGPVHDPLYARALVVKSDATTAVILAVDAVAIGEIGRIKYDDLRAVRSRLQSELNIAPANVLINASHCHGVVCADIAERMTQAVKQASRNVVPVKVGTGSGREERIMENRRLKLKDGKEADVRHAYSLPPNAEIDKIGPVDPEIGVLRLDRMDGRTLAVIYNFACHPIQGVPGGGNTADITGFASRVVEDQMGEGTIALFLQGCAGDVNPVGYKDVSRPRDAEPLGNLLGLSTLQALRKVITREDDRLKVVREIVELPRADLAQRILRMEAEQTKLLHSLKGTSLNLETFVPLYVKYGVSGEYPSGFAYEYRREEARQQTGLRALDAENRANLEQYLRNVHTMEELTRVETNLALLRKHQAASVAAGKPTIDAEVLGFRIGDFVLVTFPGEPSVSIGLAIKKASPHPRTFVAGYSNGYLYYAPTAEQLANPGCAQEDCDCLLAPEWQKRYEDRVTEILKAL